MRGTRWGRSRGVWKLQGSDGLTMTNAETATALAEVADDDALMEVGRLAIENALVEFRNSRISAYTRNNGLVCREADGKASDVIRFGPEVAVRIAMKAISSHMSRNA